MLKENLSGEYDERFELSTQSYEKSPTINGVEIISLPKFKDDGGEFMELVRLDSTGQVIIAGSAIAIAEEPGTFSAKQINLSYVYPNTVKAWHIHLNQEDLWFVPPRDRLLVGLYDLRSDSPSHSQTMRFVLGAGDAQLLKIPRGVAHGCSNPYNREMQLIYVVNQCFNPNSPDEHRLPWDSLTGSKFWEIQKG